MEALGKTQGRDREACKIADSRAMFTAAEIALKLAITKQAVRKLIGDVPPCGTVKVKGQDSVAWTLPALPPSVRSRIAAAPQRKNFRSDEEFLASDLTPWTPPLPFNQLPQQAQAEAAQWRDILEDLLARQHATPAGELVVAGIEATKRILGQPVSEDTVRRRFDLAVERDRGFGQWTRLDLYVSPSAYQAAQSATAAALHIPPSTLWPDLPDRLDELESKLAPTAEDVAHLFDAAFRQLQALLDSNVGTLRECKLKSRLAEILLNAVPSLARTEAALRRNFDRKLTAWRAGGKTWEAVLDRRDESGRKAKQLCTACREQVKGAAVSLDGDLAQAWRRLILPPKLGGIRADGKGLCDTCAGLWHFDVRCRKSYVPESVRADLAPEIAPLLIHRHGPKAAKLASPYVRRDWNDIGPGDWFEADDVTWNHMFWDQDAMGRPYVGRGECLVLVDRRTDYLIGYLLIAGEVDADGNQIAARYSATHVRRLILRGHDAVGLPHQGLVFENGIWAARLIDGEPVRGWEFNSWQRTEHGLRDPRLGLAVRHAEPGNPRSKIIEGIFGRVQNRMRPQSGFVGFSERTDKREAVQDLLRRVRAGNEHPGNEFLSMAEFTRLLDAEIMAFVREPQNGQRLPGVSPMEAWTNGIGGKSGIAARPLRKLPNGARHLLATHRRMVPVTSQGIRLRIGSGPVRVFWEDALLPYQHRQIEIAVNLEEPELLHCLPEKGEPFTLRERVLPSSTATREELADTSAARRHHVKASRVAVDNLPHPLRTNIVRDEATDAATKAQGEFIDAETAAHREAKREVEKNERRLQKIEASSGYRRAGNLSKARQAQFEDAARRQIEREARRKASNEAVTP